jgi:ketosteroid isomerase-like protein
MHTIDVPAQRQLVGDAMLRREQGDLEGFLDLFHPDCEIAFPGTEIGGIEAWRAFQRAYLSAFPDGAYDVRHNEPVRGDTVFVEGVWSATHTGTLATPEGDVPATGRRVTVPFALAVTVRDGRIASVRNYHDRLAFLAQLGLTDATTAA